MDESTITPLHGEDHAPTRIERELYKRAWAKLMPPDPLDGVPQHVIAAEMVALGVPTLERAERVINAHDAPGGLPPYEGGVPSVRWLIYQHTVELEALIRRHHPSITITELIYAFEQQALAASAKATEFEWSLESF
jgi:antirestriction protein ArdC